MAILSSNGRGSYTDVYNGYYDPETGAPINDSRNPTLSERGSKIPVLIGRDRLSPVFLWEGRPFTRVESVAGGGGGKGVGTGNASGSSNAVYFASGLHGIVVGPARRLRRIRENGETIWPRAADTAILNGITPVTHPSGTSLVVELTEEGKDRGTPIIYWGEEDQPQNPLLTAGAALGTSANLGGLMYIYWKDKRLGGPAVWQSLEYDVEVGPYLQGQLYNNGSPIDYDSLTNPSLPSSLPWTANGLEADAANETDVLRIFPGGFALELCDNPFGVTGTGLSLPFQIKDNNEAINGNYIATSVTAASAVDQPVGDFIERQVVYDIGSGGWAPGPTSAAPGVNFSATITDLNGTDTPPGVVLQPFNSATSTVVGVILTRAKFVSAVPFTTYFASDFEYVSGTPLVTSPDPDPGSPGSGSQFNEGLNYFTFYVKPVSALGTAEFTLTVSSSTPGITAVFQDRIYQGWTGVTGQPEYRTFGGTDLGNGWTKLLVGYQSPSGTTTVGPGFEFSIGDDTDFYFVWGDGTQGSDRFLEYRRIATCPNPVDVVVSDSLIGGVSYEGTVCPLVEGEGGFQGANGAHALDQLYFAEAPRGLGCDPNCYDTSGLDEAGDLLSESNEGIRSHVEVKGEDSARAAIQALQDELGIQRVWDMTQGKWAFKPIRPESPITTLLPEVVAPDPPEIRRSMGQSTNSNFSFRYANEAIGYRDEQLTVFDNDAPEVSIVKVDLKTVRDPEMASIIADRKAAIEQGELAIYKVRLMRNINEARVGDLIDANELLGEDVPFRIVAMKADHELAQTVVTLVSDPSSQVPIALGSLGPGGLSLPQAPQSPEVAPDVTSRLFELPGFFGPGIQFISLREPGAKATSRAQIITSLDDVTYSTAASQSVGAVGTLAADFSSSYTEDGYRRYNLEDGPLITQSVDSFSETQELSEADWLAGKQWMIIGDEIMYVQFFEALGGNTFQARGVLRARLGSDIGSHSFGDQAFVVPGEALNNFSVATAGRGQDLYFKALPSSRLQVQLASSVTSQSIVPNGNSIKPLPLSNLRTEDFTSSYIPGQDLTVAWSHSSHDALSNRTGLGFQNVGEATGDGLTFQGTYTVALVDNALTTLYSSVVVSGVDRVTFPASVFAAATGALQVQVIATGPGGETGERLTLSIERI